MNDTNAEITGNKIDLNTSHFVVLSFSIFIVALCGIAYELIIGAVSSYLIGNSVYQFSLTIGLFMFAMGIGSFFSKIFRKDLVKTFVIIEVIISLIGGVCSIVLFVAFPALYGLYKAVMCTFIIVIGTLVGLEIPLLTRILSEKKNLRTSLANVLSVDYVGALMGSLIFPLILLPHVGLVRSSFAIGLLNITVAAINVWVFRKLWKHPKLVMAGTLAIAALLLGCTIWGSLLTRYAEKQLYLDQVIYQKHTHYQHVVFTQSGAKKEQRLYLDGHIQFSESDEYRYHEALVHPVMAPEGPRERVLILGGGDGLVAREVLKWDEVKHIDLVDIDPEITTFCSTFEPIKKLNGGSLTNPKVKIHNTDAFSFINQQREPYDRVITDLPDPHNEGLNKLYSREFYNMIRKRMRPEGLFVTQSSSPFATRKTFWAIASTLESAGYNTLSYHITVPSFSVWGFHLARIDGQEPEIADFSVETKFLTRETLEASRVFGKDIARVDTPINTMLEPNLYFLYNQELKQ